jgi:hypothetical protein
MLTGVGPSEHFFGARVRDTGCSGGLNLSTCALSIIRSMIGSFGGGGNRADWGRLRGRAFFHSNASISMVYYSWDKQLLLKNRLAINLPLSILFSLDNESPSPQRKQSRLCNHLKIDGNEFPEPQLRQRLGPTNSQGVDPFQLPPRWKRSSVAELGRSLLTVCPTEMPTPERRHSASFAVCGGFYGKSLSAYQVYIICKPVALLLLGT